MHIGTIHNDLSFIYYSMKIKSHIILNMYSNVWFPECVVILQKIEKK